jgi:predicted metal-binding membrane protein
MTTASAPLPRQASLPPHVRTGLIFGLLLLAAVAWAVTDDRMGGMDAGPGTDAGSLGFWVTAWVVMMAAMMFPSVAPAVTEFAAARAGGRPAEPAQAGSVALFVSGYLVTWTLAGLLGYAIVESVRALDVGFLAWDEAGPYVAGGVILGAGLYQLSAPKDACLRRCREPRAFVVEHWHEGGIGALRMGIEHGGYCVGCCWALMAALFALGVMSIGWMVLVAALIAIEKLLPWQAAANRGIAILLAVLGLAVAFAPEDVPGLTIPGSPEAMRAMEAMGMEEEEASMGGAGGAMDDEMAPGQGSMEP